jgi:hypothetical protein
MKKIAILIPFFLLTILAVNAQTQQGTQNLGLSLGFYSSSGSYSYQYGTPTVYQPVTVKTTGFSTLPNYSYFIANNLDLGVSVGFGTETDKSNDLTNNIVSTQHTKNYSGSLYLRKYYLYNNKVGIRTGPYLFYQYSNSDASYSNIDQGSNTYNGKYFQGGINADFVYYPTSKIGLAVNLGSLYYSHITTNSRQQNTSANVGQNASSNSVNLQLLNNNLTLSAFYAFGK